MTISARKRGLLIIISSILAAISTLSGSAAIIINTGLNFTGATLGPDSDALPPDGNGAIGLNHYVEFINGRYSVFSKTTGARAQTMTDLSFWVQAGVTLANTNWNVTDPRICFDAGSQRWFASQVDYDATGVANSNHFLIAVSATADPTGAWKGFSTSTSPGGNNFGDFPTLGLDSKGVYLSADLFDSANNALGASLLSIPKADLVAATPTIANRTWFGIQPNRGDIMHPAVCVDGSASGAVLATDGLGYDYNIGDFATNYGLVATTILNAGGPGAASLSASTAVTVPGFSAPNNPAQPGETVQTSRSLDDGDSRMSSTAYAVGGVIYVVHETQTVELNASLRWYRINASNYTLLESGTISDPNLDLFYPSIAASANGTVVIAFNGSSPSQHVSSYAVAGNTVNGVTTFGPLVLLKAGTATYYNPDSTGGSRWGDYSATSVDPSDPTRFWTIQTIPVGTTTWATQITQLLTSPLRLAFAQSSGNLQLSWPLQAANFNLQGTADPTSSGGWGPVNQPRATNGSIISVQVPMTAAGQYFRLISGP
jgi:hypothetical protein